MNKNKNKFKIKSLYSPKGDQKSAIKSITKGLNNGLKFQTLYGATGTGKTFTISNIINNFSRPTLVLAHNKTLAAQLYNEFKTFFPDNRVEYFVSYYDYYQPEAYIASSDTYIEKDSSINDEIDKLRHSATSSLLERKDVIVVSSVSCIYGLGSPKEYEHLRLNIKIGMEISRKSIIQKLVSIQYERNDINFSRGTFRIRGDVIDIFPISKSDNSFRIELFGDEVEKIREINPTTGEILYELEHIVIYPASHFIAGEETLKKAIERIKNELCYRLKELKSQNKLLEAQRLEERTNYDIEMLEEMGFCSGIENYSLHLTLREKGSTPYTLLDYFPKDFLLVIDESHVTIPQVRAMYNGDQARKKSLVDYGFRLPSALDNRPLNFEEFRKKLNQVIFVSATPSDFEINISDNIAEQIIRPTGLLDPTIVIRPIDSQVFDLINEIKKEIKKNNRILVTTLTKKMAESLSDYLKNAEIKAKYLHSDIKTLERTKIIRDLRIGKFDVLIGINLLREGLDIPEVSLIAILDADKEGFLRGDKALLQTIGRAARNSEGRVIMYADTITKSMKKAIEETNRRRKIQKSYNKKNNIVPTTIKKDIEDIISYKKERYKLENELKFPLEFSEREVKKQIKKLEEQMFKYAEKFDFENAANTRDKIYELKEKYKIKDE